MTLNAPKLRQTGIEIFPWLILSLIVAAVGFTVWLTNTTLRSVEKDIPHVLLTELNDLANVLEELAAAAALAEIAREMPTEANLARLQAAINHLDAGIISLRDTYVFDNMIQASNFHGLVAPAINDVRTWLVEGISGFAPHSDTSLRIVHSRMIDVLGKAKELSHNSRTVAQGILANQKDRLDHFLASVNLLFFATMAVTVVLVILFVRQRTLRRREQASMTALSAAQQALQESEELHRRLLASIPDVVIRTDLDGTIIFINEIGYQQSGYSRAEIIGQNMVKFLAPEEHARALANTEKMMGQVLGPQEYQLIMKDGKRRSFEVNGDVLRLADGSPYGIVHACRDITERQRLVQERQILEQQLNRAEKMEAIGTLAGGIAHDLNNMLGVLVGYSELLLLEITPDSPWRNHVTNIHSSGQRAAAIIQDLLTLARRGVSVSQVVDINTLIGDVRATLEYQKLVNSFPGISFKLNLADDLHKIKGSPVHLGKAILNLVFNAVEAMTATGEVSIRTENRHLDLPIDGYDKMSAGDYVLVEVTDTGHGIAERDLGKIFEPFYTKKVMGRSGTGLGLAVVWGVVKDHDGSIDVESSPGTGSRFRLYFPATSELPEAAAVPVVPEHYLGRGERILVVDDVAAQRQLAETMLSRIGYMVVAMASGEAAVDYIRSGNRADLVVLDMIMDPGIDGLETYRLISAEVPGQKAIIVSGFSETENIRKAQALGAGPYVRKPYLLETIGLAVREELDRP